MARRPTTLRTPQLRLHKATGKGRIRLPGCDFYTRAPFGISECHREYLELIDLWEANDRQPFAHPED